MLNEQTSYWQRLVSSEALVWLINLLTLEFGAQSARGNFRGTITFRKIGNRVRLSEILQRRRVQRRVNVCGSPVSLTQFWEQPWPLDIDDAPSA